MLIFESELGDNLYSLVMIDEDFCKICKYTIPVQSHDTSAFDLVCYYLLRVSHSL